MPKGIYPRTEEHKKNLSRAWDYEKHFTDKCRKKISSNNRKPKSEEGKLNMKGHSGVYKRTKPIWNKGMKFPQYSGKNHPNWNGGSSFEPYGLSFNDVFKETIKIRDNCSCVICGSDNRISIHHIDYNKLNTCKENCISLCTSCHTKTNFNRLHWIKFFQSYMQEKFNYKYEKILNFEITREE